MWNIFRLKDNPFCKLSFTDSLPNGYGMRTECWWAFGCLSPLAFNLHHWLATLHAVPRKGEQSASVPRFQFIYPLHSKSYAVPSVAAGDTTRPQYWTCRGDIYLTQQWTNSQRPLKRMRTYKACVYQRWIRRKRRNLTTAVKAEQYAQNMCILTVDQAEEEKLPTAVTSEEDIYIPL